MAIYFDQAATTKPDERVLQSFMNVIRHYYGNPASLHGLGVQAEKLIRKAKEQIATFMQVPADTLTITSGGTESNNAAVFGVAKTFAGRGRHIITSMVEHPAVHEPVRMLERSGFEITYVPVDEKGCVHPEDVQKALRTDTILVTIMHVNNETGSIQPIHEIGKLLQQYPKAIFHVDAVQSIGKIPLSIRDSGIDLLTVSGHKIHAPKGVGLLYKRSGLRIQPLLHGGGQQDAFRPGTENVANTVALAKAIRLAYENESDHYQHLRLLNQTMTEGLRCIPGVQIVSPTDRSGAPHIVNIVVPGTKPEVLVHAFEEKDIFISAKSACSSKVNEPSRILTAMGLDRDKALTSLRISLSWTNTLQEVHTFLRVSNDIIPYYQKWMRV